MPGMSLRRKMMERGSRGFTLVEVVVSVVIVALTAAGIFASFIAAQNYVSRSRGRVSTSNAVRQQIENLKVEVDAEAWYQVPPPSPNCDPDSNGLALTDGFSCQSNCGICGTCTVSAEVGWTCWKPVNGTFGDPPLNGKRRYRVTLVDPLDPGGARQTEVQVNWTEPGT